MAKAILSMSLTRPRYHAQVQGHSTLLQQMMDATVDSQPSLSFDNRQATNQSVAGEQLGRAEPRERREAEAEAEDVTPTGAERREVRQLRTGAAAM